MVSLALSLKPGAQVQQGQGQKSPIDEEQGKQGPANPSVAIQKRINRLKLVVDESQSHQRWKVVLSVKVVARASNAGCNSIAGGGTNMALLIVSPPIQFWVARNSPGERY